MKEVDIYLYLKLMFSNILLSQLLIYLTNLLSRQVLL